MLAVVARNNYIAGRFTQVLPITVAGWSFEILNTTITNNWTATPEGDCLTTKPSGSITSVIRDTTPNCGGIIGNTTTPTQLTVSGTNLTAFAGASIATFEQAEPTCAAFFTDPLTGLLSYDCEWLRTGGLMSGNVTFANCVINNATSLILADPSRFLDLTLRNVTWTGGSLRVGNSSGGDIANARVALENCNMTEMDDIVVLRPLGARCAT